MREGCDLSSSDRAYTELGLPSCPSWGPELLWIQTNCVFCTPRSHLATRADIVPQNPRPKNWSEISGPCLPPSGGGARLLPSLMSLRSLRYRHWAQEVLIRPGCAGMFSVMRMQVSLLPFLHFSPSLVLCCHLAQTYTSMYFSFPLRIKHLPQVPYEQQTSESLAFGSWREGPIKKWVPTLASQTIWLPCQGPDLPLPPPLWESLFLRWGVADVALLGVV